ncbi:hypothetical protein GJ496_006778 [Pomphorhynchus laevis]|nr:hypothetical protein GJ496_006778 [Pomphorhynchus laevis]
MCQCLNASCSIKSTKASSIASSIMSIIIVILTMTILFTFRNLYNPAVNIAATCLHTIALLLSVKCQALACCLTINWISFGLIYLPMLLIELVVMWINKISTFDK